MEHLSWIKANKDFIPSDGLVVESFGGVSKTVSYYDSMTLLYNSEAWRSNPLSEELALKWLMSDIRYKDKLRKRIEEITNEALKDRPREYFVTIGFLEKSDPKHLAKVVETISNYDWVCKMSAVLEFHTKDGVHPHLHMYLSCNLAKSKIIEKIFACKGMKIVCQKKNFIDCKVGLEVHKQYILGIKQDSKQEYIMKDRKLRDSLGIPHLFEK